jgi:hypothetical protein
VSALQRLPPSEARKLLALAALTVKAQQKPRDPAAIIRMNGATITQSEYDALLPVVVHRLLDRKRRLREAPDDSALGGPLVVDLNDLAQHRQACPTCSDQATRGVQPDLPTPPPGPRSSLFDDLEWAPRATELLAGGGAAHQR